MSNLRNSVQLIGNLGRDPEILKLEKGGILAKVTLATKEYYKNAGGELVEEVNWHRLVGWGKIAERMEKAMKKGKEVTIQGRLTQRSYEDKNGIKRYVTEVRVSDFILMNRGLKKESKKLKEEVVA